MITLISLNSLAMPIIPADLCNPSPCGPNAKCSNGTCTCLSDFQGNPYLECRPECVLNSDCPRDQACSRNKCINPCMGACAANALCNVINHIPMCSCPGNMTGNAFSQCIPVKGIFIYQCISKIIKLFLSNLLIG